MKMISQQEPPFSSNKSRGGNQIKQLYSNRGGLFVLFVFWVCVWSGGGGEVLFQGGGQQQAVIFFVFCCPSGPDS